MRTAPDPGGSFPAACTAGRWATGILRRRRIGNPGLGGMRPAPRRRRLDDGAVPVADWRDAVTPTITGLRPRARLRRWLLGPAQPNLSLRLSVGLVAVLALLAMASAR